MRDNEPKSVSEATQDVLCLEILDSLLVIFHQLKHNTPVRQSCSIFVTIFDIETNKKVKFERLRHDETEGYNFDRKCQFWDNKFYLLHGLQCYKII